jgi:hypothetical protein
MKHRKSDATWLLISLAAALWAGCNLVPIDTVTNGLNGGGSQGGVATPFIPVTNITGVPSGADYRDPLSFTPKVTPSLATTPGPITWELVDAGDTGAVLTPGASPALQFDPANWTGDENAVKTVRIRATIPGGKAPGVAFVKEYDIEVTTPFVPVSDITGLPVTVAACASLTLTGTVAPPTATNQDIVWTIEGYTCGSLFFDDRNTLIAASEGTVTVKAAVVNGLDQSPRVDYSETFTITVTPSNNAAKIGNTEYKNLSDAITAAPTAGTTEIVILRNIFMDETERSTIENKFISGKHILLYVEAGKEYTIKRLDSARDNPMFNIFGSNRSLTVSKPGTGTLILDGGAVWTGAPDPVLGRGTYNDGVASTGGAQSIVAVVAGSFTLNEGGILQNNQNGSGGAVRTIYDVNSGAGSFTMNGGVIRYNDAANGGAVLIGQYSNTTMLSGEIYGNSAISGGGVANTYGYFTMQGDAMVRNNRAASGGGVDVSGAFGLFPIFTLSENAQICDNAAYSETPGLGNGGGISATTQVRLYMSGGTVAHNSASASGGGIYIGNSSTFTLSGGAVYGSNSAASLANTAGGSGASLYVGSDSTAQYGGAYTSYGSTISSPEDRTLPVAPPIDMLVSYLNAITPGSAQINTSNPSQIDLLENVTIPHTYTQDKPLEIPSGVTLSVSGHTLTVAENAVLTTVAGTGASAASLGHISLGDNATLTVNGTVNAGWGTLQVDGATDTPVVINGSGTIYLANDGDSSAYLFRVEAGKALTMSGLHLDGMVITRHGPMVSVNGGTFTMNGGFIQNNITSYGSQGGGVFVGSGSFIMNGGAIQKNVSNSASGGGVFVDSGNFTMSGGVVYGNNAGDLSNTRGNGQEGAAIYIRSGYGTAQYGGTLTTPNPLQTTDNTIPPGVE